jgi:hypothetical protein
MAWASLWSSFLSIGSGRGKGSGRGRSGLAQGPSGQQELEYQDQAGENQGDYPETGKRVVDVLALRLIRTGRGYGRIAGCQTHATMRTLLHLGAEFSLAEQTPTFAAAPFRCEGRSLEVPTLTMNWPEHEAQDQQRRQAAKATGKGVHFHYGFSQLHNRKLLETTFGPLFKEIDYFLDESKSNRGNGKADILTGSPGLHC